MQLALYAFDPSVFDRALDFDDRCFAIDEWCDHVACNKVDLHFAREECGVMSWESIRSEAEGTYMSVLMPVEP